MQDLAMQYLLAIAGLVFSTIFCWGYCWKLPAALPFASLLAVKLVNPGWLPRVMLIVPGYFHLTLRMMLRFWVRHGFKIMFVLVTISYVSATVGYASRDNPFAVISVSHTATPREIRKACRKASLEFHPDKHPGNEEEVRPQFERIARACKTLSDPKKRAKFERYGTIETEELTETASISLTSQLGWFTTCLFYTLLFVGMPVCTIYNFAHLVKSSDDQLATATSNADSIHKDMMALYEYKHHGTATLDCAELYLRAARWELDDQRKLTKSLGASRVASKLDSLCNKHEDRFALWLAYDTSEAKVQPLKAQLEQLGTAVSSSASGRKSRCPPG
jgi:hypothetical protein